MKDTFHKIMSCFGSPKTPQQSAEEKSKEIDRNIKRDRKNNRHFDSFSWVQEAVERKRPPLQLLLLGPGGSGKSTFAKQMTCRNWNIDLDDKLQSIADELMADTQLEEDVAKHVEPLWKSPAIQKAYEQRNRIQLPGGALATEYYMENAIGISREDFTPNLEDIRAKQKTTGVLETFFEVNGTEFVMVDVGGQCSEQKKWLSSFNEVSAIIYLIALNEYDMLMEDDRTNRMEESLKLFRHLTASQWLKDRPFILFLNKSDLFAEKIQQRPLSDCFEDYEDFPKGKNDFETSCEYIKTQYQRVFGGERLYSFITNSSDTGNCEKVFLSVCDAVMAGAVSARF